MWVVFNSDRPSLTSHPCMHSVCPAPPLSPTSLPEGETLSPPSPPPVPCTHTGQCPPPGVGADMEVHPGWLERLALSLLATLNSHCRPTVCLQPGVEKDTCFLNLDLFTFYHIIALPDSCCCYGSVAAASARIWNHLLLTVTGLEKWPGCFSLSLPLLNSVLLQSKCIIDFSPSFMGNAGKPCANCIWAQWKMHEAPTVCSTCAITYISSYGMWH